MAIRRVVIDGGGTPPSKPIVIGLMTVPAGVRVITIPAGKVMDGVKVYAPVGDQYAGWTAKKRDDDLNLWG